MKTRRRGHIDGRLAARKDLTATRSSPLTSMRSTETSRIAQPADEVTLATSVSTAVMVPVDLAAVCSNDSNTGSGEGGTAGSTKAGSGALSGHLVLMSVRRGCGARRSSHEHGSKNSSLFHSMLRVDALCNHAPGKRICHDRCARTRGGHLGCSSCTVAHDVVNLSAISAQSSPRRPSADLQRSLDAWQHKRGDCCFRWWHLPWLVYAQIVGIISTQKSTSRLELPP